MRRWAEILTTLVLFAVVMTGIGWVAREGVEQAYPWVLDSIGHAGIWTFFVLLWITGAILLYREKAGRAGKAAGR